MGTDGDAKAGPGTWAGLATARPWLPRRRPPAPHASPPPLIVCSELDVSDLLASSYASLFAVEAGRRLKAVPTAFYRAPPERLFEAGGAGADWAGWVL